jgi:hypothetical protein
LITGTAQHRKLSNKMCPNEKREEFFTGESYGQVCVYIYYNLATCINKTNPFAAFIKGRTARPITGIKIKPIKGDLLEDEPLWVIFQNIASP